MSTLGLRLLVYAIHPLPGLHFDIGIMSMGRYLVYRGGDNHATQGLMMTMMLIFVVDVVEVALMKEDA
eukprot:2135198-Rhodomonas_salina.1